jgi:hypothetical protein
LNAFLVDPYVAGVLQPRGIAFHRKPPPPTLAPGERAYTTCGFPFNTTKCSSGTPSCCEWTSSGPTEYVCCDIPNSMVERVCVTACLSYVPCPNGINDCPSGCNSECSGAPAFCHASTDCGKTGKQGCAACWSLPYNSTCSTSGSCSYSIDTTGNTVYGDLHVTSGSDPALWQGSISIVAPAPDAGAVNQTVLGTLQLSQ